LAVPPREAAAKRLDHSQPVAWSQATVGLQSLSLAAPAPRIRKQALFVSLAQWAVACRNEPQPIDRCERRRESDRIIAMPKRQQRARPKVVHGRPIVRLLYLCTESVLARP
jgi:hypothetical protein